MIFISSISEKLLEAMQIMIKGALKNYKADYTIECQIIGIGVGIGEYKVSYMDNTFSVYGDQGKYNIGDFIYVTVPNGDFNAKKIIKGITSFSIKTDVKSTESENRFNEKSSNIIFGCIPDKELISWNEKANEANNQTGLFSLEEKADEINEYMKDFSYIKLSFEVKTEITESQRHNGDYGIILLLPFLDETGEKITRQYILSTESKMIGSVYNYNTFQNQEGVYLVDNLKYDNSRSPVLEVFCNDFTQDETIKTPDIFIRNIGFSFLEEISAEELENYSLNIQATDGRYFTESFKGEKQLIPQFKIKGVSSSIDNLDIFWFKQNNSIGKDDSKYCKEGGVGWECLNTEYTNLELPDGKTLKNYNSMKSIAVSLEDVFIVSQYKCIIKYDDCIVQDIIEIKNLLNNCEIQLKTEDGITNFFKDIGSVNLSCRILGYEVPKDNMLYFYWNRFDEKLNFIESFDTNRGNLSFGVNTIDRINNISVSVIELTKDLEERFLGTKTITLFNLEETDYVISVLNDNQNFKYDAMGNSPLSLNKELIIKPLIPKIYKNNSLEFTENEYNSVIIRWGIPKKNSLLIYAGNLNESELISDEEYNYFEEKDLYFSIKKNYFASSSNTVKLEVTIGGKVYTSFHELIFLKDGENGTNGTELYAKIRYFNEDNKEVPLRLGFDVESSKWFNLSNNKYELLTREKLLTEVFNNGEKLSQNDYSLTWEMFDTSVTKPCVSITKENSFPYYGVVRPSKTVWNESSIYCNIVKATIKILKGNYANQQINVFYPIDVIRFENMTDLNSIFPSLVNGFSNVTYASDGTNPSFGSNKFKLVLNSYSNSYEQSLNYAINSNINLELESQSNNEFTINPISKYDNGDSCNYIKIKMNFDEKIKNYLENEKNNLNFSLESLKDGIENLNKEKYALSNFIGSFNYENLYDKLSNFSYLLFKRSELISKINILIDDILIAEELQKSNSSLEQYCNISWEDYISHLNIEKNNLYNICLGNFRNCIPISFDEIIEFPLFEDISLKMKSIRLNSYIENIRLSFLYINNLIDAFNKDEQITSQRPLFMELYNELYNVISLGENFGNYTVTNYLISLLNDLLNTKGKELYSEYNILGIINNFRRTIYYYSNAEREINTETEKEYLENLTVLENEREKRYNELKSIEELLKIKGSIIYISPIIMLYNCYEMSNLNAWDGNKIYTDVNGEYILAPQMGAGIKESDNSFTGLVMGLKSTNYTSKTEAGLYAYNHGVQTIRLSAEDGSAIFGRSGSGQIKMIPYGTSTIAGWEINEKSLSRNSGTNRVVLNSDADETTKAFEATNGDRKTYIQYNGFFFSNSGEIGAWSLNDTTLTSKNKGIVLDSSNDKISLANGSIVLDGSAKEIKCGSHFTVNSDGEVTMSKGTVGSFHLVSTGLYNDDQTLVLSTVNGLKVKKGTIGGWTINSNMLSTNDGDVYLKSNGTAKFGDNFSVSSTGKIVSKSGSIGGWEITSDRLKTSDGTVYLKSDGTAKFGDNFSVSSSGKITSNSGTIGGWTITSDRLKTSNGSVYLKSDGSAKFGNDFSISSAGKITAKSGSIGGWTIGESTLTGGSVVLNKTGALKGKQWNITADGTATFSDLNATGGKVGGWTIGTSKLVGGTLTLNNTGAISGSKWGITAGGTATFADINVTGGKINISGSGTSINGSGTRLTESSTKVGQKGLGTYVKDLCVDTLTASKIKTSQLEADSINGKSVSWATMDIVSAIRCQFKYYTDIDRFITRMIFTHAEIDGQSVITDIETEGVRLDRIVNDIVMEYDYRTATILAGGTMQTKSVGKSYDN